MVETGVASSSTGTSAGETRGRVADRPLGEVVKELAGRQFTGAVALNLGPLEGTLTFEQGQVTAARLGDLSGRPAFFRAMAATAGAFTIKPARAGKVHSSLGEVGELLDQVAKHDAEIRSLAGDVGGLDRVWSIRFAALKRVLNVLPDEINPLLRLLDGRRTVREVLAATTLDDVLVLRVMHRLLTMGVLVLPDEHLDGQGASPVGEALDGGRVAVIGSDLEVSAQWFEEHSQPGRKAPPLDDAKPAPPAPQRPATKADEAAAKADEAAAKADEPASKADEPASKADEAAAKADEPASKADEVAAKADEDAAKADEAAATADDAAAKADDAAAKADDAAAKADDAAAKADEPVSKADEAAAKADEPEADEAAAKRRRPTRPRRRPTKLKRKPMSPRPTSPRRRPTKPRRRPTKPRRRPTRPRRRPTKLKRKPTRPRRRLMRPRRRPTNLRRTRTRLRLPARPMKPETTTRSRGRCRRCPPRRSRRRRRPRSRSRPGRPGAMSLTTPMTMMALKKVGPTSSRPPPTA
jgi:hypothetical protein